MNIDLLYFEGCPSWHEGLENLKAALIGENIQAEINLVRVDDDADAARLKFLGSPSFRVDGEELWPEGRDRYNLSCRVYPTSAGMKGVPTVEMLRKKLHELKKS
jgi:hypothetical protein